LEGEKKVDEKSFVSQFRQREISVADLVRETAAEDVDRVVALLLRHLPTEDVCRALYERIAAAPLEEFETLKAAYFKHCAP
jgi:Tfp pilus assembly protein PilO